VFWQLLRHSGQGWKTCHALKTQPYPSRFMRKIIFFLLPVSPLRSHLSCVMQVVFTRLGVALAMVFVSFPFVVRTMQPVIQVRAFALSLEIVPCIDEWRWCYPFVVRTMQPIIQARACAISLELGSVVKWSCRSKQRLTLLIFVQCISLIFCLSR